MATVNDWARFQVDAGRKAHRAIVAMRKRGELADKGGDRKSKSTGRTLILHDLIAKRATQRASEWAKLDAAGGDDSHKSKLWNAPRSAREAFASTPVMQSGATYRSRCHPARARHVCSNYHYRIALQEGAIRIGLDGEPAGVVTADAAASARQKLAEERKLWQQQQAEKRLRQQLAEKKKQAGGPSAALERASGGLGF